MLRPISFTPQQYVRREEVNLNEDEKKPKNNNNKNLRTEQRVGEDDVIPY